MKKTISRTSAVLLAGAAMCALAAFGATNVITNDRSGPDVAAQVQVERAYGFRERLETVHEKGVRDRTLTVAADELVLADGTDIVIPPSSGEVLYGAARDFADYLFVSMDVSARVMRGTRDEGRGMMGGVVLSLDEKLAAREYEVSVENGIAIRAKDERMAAQALYHLEDLMNLRRAPFLKKGVDRRESLFSPRMTHSAWGWDDFPDAYLRKIAHTGMDAILVCISDVDKTCGNPRYQDVRSLIRRAAAVGLDTYLYWKDNFDERAYVHPDDPKAEEGYDAVYGRVSKAYPDAKGFVFVGESAPFPSKDPRVLPSKTIGRNGQFPGDTRPLPGWFPCNDYHKWAKAVSGVIRKYNPKSDFVFWTYNWGDKDEMARMEMIDKLQKDLSLLVTYETFESYALANGFPCHVDDYTLAFAGPGKYFVADAKRAKKNGLPLYAQSMTGGNTWDDGVVPYLPVPHQWKRRWDGMVRAHDDWGLVGVMEGHHNAAEPSFVTELEKEAFTRGGIPFDRHIRLIAARDFGEVNADAVVAVWRKWSEALPKIPPSHNNQYGPFRIGPAYPFNALGKPLFGSLGEDLDKTDFPIAPYAVYGLGNIRLNYADDQVRQFVEGLDYFPRLQLADEDVRREVESIGEAERLYREGTDTLRALLPGLSGPRAEKAGRLVALGGFLWRTCRTAINVKKATQLENVVLSERATAAEKAAAREGILTLARDEYANAKATIPVVRTDSHLGWEPSMEYVGGEEQIRWKLGKMESLYGKEALEGKGR